MKLYRANVAIRLTQAALVLVIAFAVWYCVREFTGVDILSQLVAMSDKLMQ